MVPELTVTDDLRKAVFPPTFDSGSVVLDELLGDAIELVWENRQKNPF